ncbi:mycobactin polyketide synthase MbtD [Mycobacterium sp. E740]|uniref:mycobactin polyketide synthase MbtD n=1 Tax=Mycobacterium sp. E740 TaxID=1834149 RepID=UPI0007FDB263|nr:mycobactin polyketide synthase MbtD [Mycobacterium sp. E740]OBI80286.1 polyketide synthase [Mycobacterium sp. E740]
MPSVGLPDGRVPVVLSSHAEELVRTDAEAILRYLDQEPDVRAVAATLLRVRRLRRHRAVVRAADTAELADGLRAVIAGSEHPLVARSSRTSALPTAFVFPGQGSQWPSMGAETYRRSAVYRTHVDQCAAAFVAAGESSPLPYLTGDAGDAEYSQTQVQAAQFTHAVGLAHIWRSCGILPAVVIGHSLGEVAAACVAGSLALPDAARVVIARAKAVDRLCGDYRMAALGVSLSAAEQLIATVPGWLEVSAVNSDASVAVSGTRAAVRALIGAAAERGLFARELDVNYPGHTSALQQVRDHLFDLLPEAGFVDSAVRFIGSTTGDVVPASTPFTDYWFDNLRNTVRFDRAVAAARRHGAEAFIEMSAHPALQFALGDLLADETDEPLVAGSGHRDTAPMETLSASIAATAIADPAYRWADLLDIPAEPILRGFPNAAMRAVRLWAERQQSPPVTGLTVAREKWQRAAQSSAVAQRVAVVELPGPRGPLAGRLRAALSRTQAELVQPRDANLVVAVAPELDHPDAEHSADTLSRHIDAGLLHYVDSAGPDCRAVCLVTVGGERVRPDEPTALPAQAALAAMHRSIGFERSEQAFRHLDLPSWEPDDTVAAAAAHALLGDAHEAAVRDYGTAPVLFTRTVTGSAESAPAWQLDHGVLDDVVITGGNGVVGLHFARYLAAHGARRLVLLSRGGVDATVTAELKAADLEVVAPRCDVASAEQVAATAAQFGGAGASLLIHAAGTATFADHNAVTAAAFTDMAAAKIGGLARLTEFWPMRPDARILLCSSISGVWGGRGHAGYSAVNRMLDVMAGQLRAKGQRCVAIRYGLWQGNGIADAGEVARIERSGLLPMAPLAAVEASLAQHGEDPLLMSADQVRLRMFLDSRTATRHENRFATAEFDVTDTAARLRTELGAVLNVEAASVDLELSLLDMGVDSLLALDLRKRLLRATGQKVPLATLLGGITGGGLVAELDRTKRSEKVDTRD